MQPVWLLYETKNNIRKCEMSSRTLVRIVMNKDEVIELMTEFLINMNRNQAVAMGMPLDEIENTVKMMEREFDRVNGLLYDLLAEYNVIQKY